MNILITGGSKGIGRAILTELSKDGENIIYFTYNKTQLRDLPANCHAIKVDFTDFTELNTFLDLFKSINIDVLINNYHTGYNLSHAHKIDIANLSNGMSFNIYPTIVLTNTFVLQFRKAKKGKIITILTHAIHDFPSGFAQYVAEKRYLSAFVDAWQNENKAFGVSSSAILPGFIPTDIHQSLPEYIKESNNLDDPLITVLNELNTLIYAI